MDTEKQPPENAWIDKMSIQDATQVMLINHQDAFLAVHKALPQINKVIEKIFAKLENSDEARLIYAGAGTSARIAVQDAVELYPTFGWPKNRIAFMFAGGNKAILTSVEGAEDKSEDVKSIGKKICITSKDVLIGLAASGNTPYTKECIKFAKAKNAITVAISNNKNGKILKEADYNIFLDTGFEIIAGSTRLKAATAQKICLNIISSMIMTKFGFVKNGLMTHFIASNRKLKKRKLIVSRLTKNN